MVEVEVIELKQPGLSMYVGKMKARDLIRVTNVDTCFHEVGVEKGYQRGVLPVRTEEIASYIAESNMIALPSSIVLAMRRESEVESLEADGRRYLKIPDKRELWICDGQHRISGIERLQKFVEKEGKYGYKELEKGMQMELPVTFIDLREIEDPEKAIAIERAVFFIMNETQKRVPAALRDNLMYLMAMSNSMWHPIIRNEARRVESISIAKKLNRDDDSPLRDKIKETTERGLSRPVNLNTLSRAIEGAFGENNKFRNIGHEKQVTYIKNFFRVLGDIFPVFVYDSPKKYLILGKAAVTYALMKIANDVYNEFREDGEPPGYEKIREAIDPLKDLDFTNNSPLSAFGGYEGVRIIYWNWLRTVLENERKLSKVERPERMERIAQKFRRMAEMLQPSS